MKTVNIKGKDYVEVNERLKFFRSEKKYEGYSLESEVISLENGVITIKAIIKDGNGVVKATGLAQEKESSSFINKTSFVENCETSAWGRALGNLGIGIDTSVASANEVINAIQNQKTDPEPKPTLREEVIKEHIQNIKMCQNRSDLELYWATLTIKEKNNKQIFDVFMEMGKKYPKVELVRDADTGEIKEVQS